MKKLLLVLIVALLIAGCKLGVAKAEVSVGEIIAKLPTVNTGVFYNLNDSKFETTSTITLAQFKGWNLNAGWASKQSAVMSLAYQIIVLEKLGIKVDILKDIVIDAGYTFGVNRLDDRNMEFINGPSITLKAKW